MTDVRWGVWYSGPHEYESKEEAEKQLFLAQMDVPARLIFDRGDGWRDSESGRRLGKAGFADDIKIVEDYSRDHLPDDVDGAVVSLMGKLEAIEELLEQRKRFMTDCKEKEQFHLLAGDHEMAVLCGKRASDTQREVGRLRRILYDE